jgi:hypothetical protein
MRNAKMIDYEYDLQSGHINVSVAVSTRVASIASFVLTAAVFSVMVAVVTIVVVSGAMCNTFVAISLAGDVIAASSLGDGTVGMAIVAVGADVLSAVITACTAAIFAFSCRFFLWARFPCPGPSILVGAR